LLLLWLLLLLLRLPGSGMHACFLPHSSTSDRLFLHLLLPSVPLVLGGP
jgi:hypothetical protein